MSKESKILKDVLVVEKKENYTLVEFYDTRGNVEKKIMLSKKEAEELKEKL